MKMKTIMNLILAKKTRAKIVVFAVYPNTKFYTRKTTIADQVKVFKAHQEAIRLKKGQKEPESAVQ